MVFIGGQDGLMGRGRLFHSSFRASGWAEWLPSPISRPRSWRERGRRNNPFGCPFALSLPPSLSLRPFTPRPESQAGVRCLGTSQASECHAPVCPLALHWVGGSLPGAPLSESSVLPVFIWVPGVPTALRPPGHQVREGTLPLGPSKASSWWRCHGDILTFLQLSGKEQGVGDPGAGVPHPPGHAVEGPGCWGAWLAHGLFCSQPLVTPRACVFNACFSWSRSC